MESSSRENWLAKKKKKDYAICNIKNSFIIILTTYQVLYYKYFKLFFFDFLLLFIFKYKQQWFINIYKE